MVAYTFTGGSVTPSTEATFVNGSDVTFTGTATGGPTVADTLFMSGVNQGTATHYFTFNLQADSGYQLTLNQVSLDYGRTHNNGPTQYSLRVSTDGFSSHTELSAGSVTGDTFPLGTLNPSLTLTGITGVVEFRMYYWNAGAANRGGLIDNVLVDGTVSAIPEPSTYALLGLGLGALWWLRRKRV
ncbi:MAG: PEP-CTERM sorting domain-containing protein [Blastochloris sp.]|nr:PEP-CTERM sorting domain-containing protein [Blastochloris sp.]